MYGLGIRIGFCLQWYAGDLASWLAPSEVYGTRLTKSIFIAATFLIQVILNVLNLQVVELYVILLLTFGQYSCNHHTCTLPTTGAKCSGS